MVVHCSSWLEWLDEARDFDANNTNATTANRESRRVISTSQLGSSAWLAVIGDRNLRYSRVRSPTFRAALQYRSGLYVSALTAPLDEMQVRGERVTQADRLGDTAVNSTNTTTRHNRFNRAVYDALQAVAEGSVILGDKGDGSPRAKEEAARKHAHFNKGHCPDIIEPDDPDRLYESRVYSCFRAASAKGLGSTAKGGKPSTNEGHTHAFGCTREDIRRTALGCQERGDAAGAPFNHSTGDGYVALHDGQYKDALSHQREVWVLVAEVTGALDETTAALLRRLATKAEMKGHADRTCYGSARAAPRDFMTHHTRTLSLAIATAVGDAITMHASIIKSRLAAPPLPHLADFCGES
jgi:hypothetical protein